MGENAKDGAQWLLSALPLWELHLCGNHECSKPWLERKKNTKLGIHDTIGRVLKHICLMYLYIVHLKLICMSYDQKKGQGQIGNLTPNHKPFEGKSQMSSNWAMLHTIGNIFLKVINITLEFSKKI